MYMGFRLSNQTLGIKASKALNHLKSFWKQPKYNMTRYTWGVEDLDKFGQPCKGGQHIHFHCYIDPEKADVKKDSIQKDFRKFMSNYDIKINGKAHYALMYNVAPEDETRWFRYCFKEATGSHGCSLDMDKFMEIQSLIAQDERKRQIEANIQAQERFLDKSSFKGKMYIKLDEDGVDEEEQFAIAYIDYCRSKGHVPSFSKISDYWIDYQMSTGRMTSKYWVAKYYKPIG